MARSNRARRRNRDRKPHRRHFVESLEPRLLLAADTADDHIFADALRSAVGELDRVVNAIDQAATLQADIPWLGSLAQENVGATSAIDPTSFSDLFDLPGLFQSQIAEPIISFLDTNPEATAAEVAGAFPFVTTVGGIPGIAEGVEIQLDFSGDVASPLAGLLEPLQDNSLLQSVAGDSLDTLLNFHLDLRDFSFEVLRDTAGDIGISIPVPTLDLSHAGSVPIDFAAQLGFLSGTISDGEIALDLEVAIDPGDLFFDLIPGLIADATNDAVIYDPLTQTLHVTLEFMRQPDPIEAQANISLFAGNENSPVATVQMDPGETGDANRLTITRDATLGMSLAIDLSPRDKPPGIVKRDVAAAGTASVSMSTPMSILLARKGLAYEIPNEQRVMVELASGQTVELFLGVLDASVTVGEVLDRAPVLVAGQLLLDMEFEEDRFVLIDHTTGSNEFRLADDAGPFWTTLFVTPAEINGEGKPTLRSTELSTAIFSSLDQPLEAVFDPTDSSLDEPSSPIVVKLRDGTEETISFGPLRGATLGMLLDAFTIPGPSGTVLQAIFEAGSIILQDLTNHQWRPELAGASGKRSGAESTQYLRRGRSRPGDCLHFAVESSRALPQYRRRQ